MSAATSGSWYSSLMSSCCGESRKPEKAYKPSAEGAAQVSASEGVGASITLVRPAFSEAALRESKSAPPGPQAVRFADSSPADGTPEAGVPGAGVEREVGESGQYSRTPSHAIFDADGQDPDSQADEPEQEPAHVRVSIPASPAVTASPRPAENGPEHQVMQEEAAPRRSCREAAQKCASSAKKCAKSVQEYANSAGRAVSRCGQRLSYASSECCQCAIECCKCCGSFLPT